MVPSMNKAYEDAKLIVDMLDEMMASGMNLRTADIGKVSRALYEIIGVLKVSKVRRSNND